MDRPTDRQMDSKIASITDRQATQPAKSQSKTIKSQHCNSYATISWAKPLANGNTMGIAQCVRAAQLMAAFLQPHKEDAHQKRLHKHKSL